jgi:hypothetical protein
MRHIMLKDLVSSPKYFCFRLRKTDDVLLIKVMVYFVNVHNPLISSEIDF